MLTIQSSTADGALILVSAAISMINIGAAGFIEMSTQL